MKFGVVGHAVIRPTQFSIHIHYIAPSWNWYIQKGVSYAILSNYIVIGITPIYISIILFLFFRINRHGDSNKSNKHYNLLTAKTS